MNNIDIKDIIKRLYEYGFRFIESKSIIIIYTNDKYRFISLYYDNAKKYWNKDACIKCWCEVDLNNDYINIYKTEPELKEDETIDDIFCGYDDNRIDFLISNVKNDIPNIKSNSIKYVNKDMIIITVIYE